MNDKDLQELLAEASRILKELAEAIDRYLERKLPVEARLEMLKQEFPENLKKLVKFETADDRVVVKPKGYLGRENFMRIAGIIKKAGGEYISAGKESHFQVPKR